MCIRDRALAAIILGAGIYRALASDRLATSSAAETAQAEALAGKCLAKVSKAADAGYAPTPVPCSAANAAGKVVDVVTWSEGKGACPSGTTVAILTSGVTHPHLECIQALAGH